MDKKLKHFGALSEIPAVKPHRQEAIRAYGESEMRIPYHLLVPNLRKPWYVRAWRKVKAWGFKVKHIVQYDILKHKVNPEKKHSPIEHKLLVERVARKPEQASPRISADRRVLIDHLVQKSLMESRSVARDLVKERTPLQDAEYRARKEQVREQLASLYKSPKHRRRNKKKGKR